MTFSWWTFLFEALNFLVLAYILHRLLYRPLRAAIDQRRQANARAQELAEKAGAEAEALQQRLREQLAGADQQRQELIHQARAQAEADRQKLLAEAEQAAQRRQLDSRQAIETERQELLTSLQQELLDQAVNLTRRLLAEVADRTLHQQLVLRLLQTLEQAPQMEKEQLQASWQAGDGPVLESAQDLDAGTLQEFNRAVSAIVGLPVSLAVRSRPELLGGARLRLAGQVWDGSLAGQVALDGSSASPEMDARQ